MLYYVNEQQWICYSIGWKLFNSRLSLLSITWEATIMLAKFLGSPYVRTGEPHTIVVYGITCIDRPTDRVRPFHVILTRCTCPQCHAAIPHSCEQCSARSGDSYKTENADNGKTKNRDTHAMNCEAGMRERPANFFILVLLVGIAIHLWVSNVSQNAVCTCCLMLESVKKGLCEVTSEKDTCTHVMHTGMHRPHPLA